MRDKLKLKISPSPELSYVVKSIFFSRWSPHPHISGYFKNMPYAETSWRHIGIPSFTHITMCFHYVMVSSRPPTCGLHCPIISGTATPPSRRIPPLPSVVLGMLGLVVCHVHYTLLTSGCSSLSVPCRVLLTPTVHVPFAWLTSHSQRSLIFLRLSNFDRRRFSAFSTPPDS